MLIEAAPRVVLTDPDADGKQTVYHWDGRRRITVQGEPWWALESDWLDVLAAGVLYHLTGERELSDRLAHTFADQLLWPHVGHSIVILSGAVETWIHAVGVPARAPVYQGPTRAIPCVLCATPVAVHPRHADLVSTFGAMCEACHG